MCSTKADVVMAQETHVVGDQVASFRHKLERAGWKVIGAPAVATVGRGSSGGVMVAARAKIGLGYAPGDSSGVVVEGRIAAAHVAAGCKGGLVCYTVYLYPSEGLSDRNVKLLESLAIHARGHGKPWLAGGDWNMEPLALEEAQWPLKMGAVIRAVSDPIGTCAKGAIGSNIDYFLVDRRLKWVAAEPQVDMSFRPNPHRPVNILVAGKAHSFVGKYRVLPKSVPLAQIFGPRREPMVSQWKQLEEGIQAAKRRIEVDPSRRGTAAQAVELNEILRQFEGLAEHEVAAGQDIFLDRHRYVGRHNARFAIKPVLGWRTKEVYQASSISGPHWRWTHSQLAEIVRMEWAVRNSRRKIGGEVRKARLQS